VDREWLHADSDLKATPIYVEAISTGSHLNPADLID